MKLTAVVCAFTLSAACSLPAPTSVSDWERWVGSWATSPQLVEPANMPPAPGLAGNTLRQVIRSSIGGTRLRVRLSNAFGNAPLVINAGAAAGSTGGSAIEAASNVALEFAGKRPSRFRRAVRSFPMRLRLRCSRAPP